MKSELRELIGNDKINDEFFIPRFSWEGPPPKAGQFFMIKPEYSSVFLPRPFGFFEYIASEKEIAFLIARKGRGTEELAKARPGARATLTGPLGRSWADFLPLDSKDVFHKIALISGGAGIAPLAALVAEKPNYDFHFYAGFKNGFEDGKERDALLGSAAKAGKLVVTAEDGKNAQRGLALDLFPKEEDYDVILACGPAPMLKAVRELSLSRNIPCYLSMEIRMACGVGACRGCVIHAENGNRRCCADGPIFSAKEIIFDGQPHD